MYEKNLFSSGILSDCDGNSFEVAYYVTDTVSAGPSRYGVLIEKGNETYHAGECFINKDNALRLLGKLSQYSITPSAADEVMDHVLEQCDFAY